MNQYAAFLETKRREWRGCGIEAPELPSNLYEFQARLTRWALRKGRAAIFADTGLGKTRMQLAWASQIPGRVLIFAPLCVAPQTIAEGQAIGVSIAPFGSGERVEIVNYEQRHHVTPNEYAGVVLDESSIMKSFDGKTRSWLIEAFHDTPYRLCCTATPAPNDIAELANHCEFLGLMTRMEMLATFFVHDDDGWRLKGHAHQAFYRWLASWGMFLRRPSDLGFSDDGYLLPELTIRDVVVTSTTPVMGEYLFPELGLGGLHGRLAARRNSLMPRVRAALQLIAAEPHHQWIVWCGLNEEQQSIAAALNGECVSVAGSDAADVKQDRIDAFLHARARVLITKPRIAGFGLNLQACARMIFLGLGDSYETYYQSIRRCWRFGQQQPVTVLIVVAETETQIIANVRRKEAEASTLASAMVAAVRDIEKEEISMTTRQRETITHDVTRGGAWTFHLGDCVEVMRKELADACVDLSIYSPPFIALYTYTNSERDLGNASSKEEFFEHFGYVVRELLRITKPGRVTCCHLSQVPAMLSRDGFIGMKDMRGPTVQLFEQSGWIYQGEIVIDKDPQAQAIRVHAKGLAFGQLRKDASWMRPALADYILIFRAPGTNAVPIKPDITNDEWIEWARPIWYGIRESDVLRVHGVRGDDDDRHICPLQLGTIERCVRLWSNPGELIVSPFGGIASEGHESLRLGRRFWGVELKREYWEAGCKNLAAVDAMAQQLTILSDSPQ